MAWIVSVIVGAWRDAIVIIPMRHRLPYLAFPVGSYRRLARRLVRRSVRLFGWASRFTRLCSFVLLPFRSHGVVLSLLIHTRRFLSAQFPIGFSIVIVAGSVRANRLTDRKSVV